MGNNFEIVKFTDNDFELDVKIDEINNTVWLSQEQISMLFGKSRTTITEHISNIFKEKELNGSTYVGKPDISGNHKTAKLYNLDVIISVGYRVKSQKSVVFRQWANKILKECSETEKIKLYNNDRDKLLSALENPPAPNSDLIQLLKH